MDAKAEMIPLGLHFNLDFERYLDDPGLGSGDVRLLAKNPSSWWWNSPNGIAWRKSKGLVVRGKPKKKAFDIGTATHKLLLEGRKWFDATYVRAPDQAEGLSSWQKGAATRAFNTSMAQSNLIPLLAEDYDRILISAEAVQNNPYLASAFQDGHAEVSVFFEREGIRLKGRFDYLKIMKRPGFMLAANGDLKTIENIYLEEFKRACRKNVAEYDYDAQAAHYLHGLSRVPQMIREDRVFGHDGYDKVDGEWLKKFLSSDLRFAWQWIFLQKNDMPQTYSYTMTPGFEGQPGSPIFEEGASKVNVGIQRYIDCVERFGLDKPWKEFEPPEELVPEEMPRWYGSR